MDLLQHLLKKQPAERLGNGPTGTQDIMQHKYFNDLKWDDIYYKRVQAPFRPEMKSHFNTSNFDPEITNVIPALTPVHSGRLSFIAQAVGQILTRKLVLSEAVQEKFRRFSAIGNKTPL